MGKIHISNQSRLNEIFESITLDNMTGYLRNDFNLPAHWNVIRSSVDTHAPYYALKDWRRVFRIPLPEDNIIYLKIVDEQRHEKGSFLKWLFSTEASRYFSTYCLFKQNDIPTPEVLFTLGEKKGLFWVKSILGTRELRDYVALSEYFADSAPSIPVKEMVIRETARVAAKLHSLGCYFSMDGRNIFIRKPYLEGETNISLIDLDHVRKSRLALPERRRKRNLARFRSTIREAPGLDESDYGMFISLYNDFFRENRSR